MAEELEGCGSDRCYITGGAEAVRSGPCSCPPYKLRAKLERLQGELAQAKAYTARLQETVFVYVMGYPCEHHKDPSCCPPFEEVQARVEGKCIVCLLEGK